MGDTGREPQRLSPFRMLKLLETCRPTANRIDEVQSPVRVRMRNHHHRRISTEVRHGKYIPLLTIALAYMTCCIEHHSHICNL
ncbi:UNVERIFIED_CONTAM: hypothetical protein FKN15_019976 [Acipenser sinensis]